MCSDCNNSRNITEEEHIPSMMKGLDACVKIKLFNYLTFLMEYLPSDGNLLSGKYCILRTIIDAVQPFFLVSCIQNLDLDKFGWSCNAACRK